MNEQELRELDEWISQHVNHFNDQGELHVWFTYDHRPDGLLCYSSSPRVFSLVAKREIERRGWFWRSTRWGEWTGSSRPFHFVIVKEPKGERFEAVGETEEIAGCLALKHAILLIRR